MQIPHNRAEKILSKFSYKESMWPLVDVGGKLVPASIPRMPEALAPRITYAGGALLGSTGGAWRIFRAVKNTLYDTIMIEIHPYTFVQTPSIHNTQVEP